MISKDVRYKFGRVQLKKGIYSPKARSDLEAEQRTIRELALNGLSGQRH